MNIGIRQDDDVDMRFTFSPKEMDLLDIRGVNFIHPINVRIYHIKKSIANFEILLNVSTRIQLDCSDCLESFEQDMVLDLKIDDEELEFMDDYECNENPNLINILPFIREELIISSPDYAICSDDCKGLCPKCGKNLNYGRCDCVIEENFE